MKLCPQCQKGHLQATTAPYVCRMGGQMMFFPSMPAYVCQVCQHVEHDTEYIEQMNLALTTGQKPAGFDFSAATKQTAPKNPFSLFDDLTSTTS